MYANRPDPIRSNPVALSALVTVTICAMVPCLGGCAQFRSMLVRAPEAPVVFQGLPESSQLLATIRANSESVRQLESDVKLTMDGMPSGISGTLLVERPNRLRLKAGILGMTNSGIDIGNNEERFWVFNKSSFGGQTPVIYYARHEDFRNSPLQQSFPVQPQWLIDALGLMDVDQLQDVQGPFRRNDGFLELRATSFSSTGTFNRLLTIDPQRGWIVQQAIYDPSNRLVAWSRSTNFRFYAESNASLPGHVDLHFVGPNQQDSRLSVTLHSHNINKLYVDPGVTWQMPQPADVPGIDLMTLDPESMKGILPGQGGTAGGNTSQVEPPRPGRMGQLRGFNLR